MKRPQAPAVTRPIGPPAVDCTPISRHRLINCLHARVVELVTVIYLLYLLLGTLIPFDFTCSAAFAQDSASSGLLGLGSSPSGLPDLLSNIGLYLVLGVLLYWSLVRTIGCPRLSILMATTIAAVTSLAVESIQLLSPTRISSIVDFGANVVGAAGGATLACLCRWPERRFLAALTRELRTNTSTTLVKIYAGVLVIGGLAPYTPTFDLVRLARSVRHSSFVPYAQVRQLAAQAREAELEGKAEVAAGFQRDRMHLWVRWLAEFLSFGLLGYLLHRLLRGDYGFQPAAALALLAYLAALLALLISLLQVGIMSRGFHLTEILMRLMGALAGGVAAAVVASRREKRPRKREEVWPRLARAALAVAVTLVLFSGLAPFAFDFEGLSVAAKAASDDFLPFYSYHIGRFDRVCADFWGKSLRYGFLGIALWAYWQGPSRRTLELRALSIAAVALLISVLIETCQLFLLSRIPSLTDVIIAPFAAWVGVICAQYAADYYRHTVRLAPPSTAGEPGQSATGRTLPPTDALIASLIPEQEPKTKLPQPSKEPKE